MAERDLPYEVPELRYVEVEDQTRSASMRFQSSNWWGETKGCSLKFSLGSHNA